MLGFVRRAPSNLGVHGPRPPHIKLPPPSRSRRRAYSEVPGESSHKIADAGEDQRNRPMRREAGHWLEGENTMLSRAVQESLFMTPERRGM